MGRARWVILALVGCTSGSRPTTHGALGGGVVARVGSATLSEALVAEVAAQERVTPSVAVDRLVDDALAAEAARDAALDRASGVSWAIRTTLARRVVDEVTREAAAVGPPTDDEVARATDAHWRVFALPEQAKVLHVVVLRPQEASQVESARTLANTILAAEAGATGADDFEARAKAVPHDGLDRKIERLDAFVADGRTAEGAPGDMDPTFVKAAFALQKPGDQSAVVETPFGWHVIRLIERRPAHMVPLEERRQALAAEILAGRARELLDELLTAARRARPVAQEIDAPELMARAIGER